MRSFVGTAVRAVSYLFHLGLGLVLVALAVTALLSPETTFTLGILPWEGSTLAWIALAAGLVALLAVYLALRGVLRVLLLLWSAAVLVALLHGYFLSRYHFGRESPTTALLLVGGATLATLGSWLAVRRKARPVRPVVSNHSERG